MKQTTVRLPEEIDEKLKQSAEENYISKNSLIIQALKEKFIRDKEA